MMFSLGISPEQLIFLAGVVFGAAIGGGIVSWFVIYRSRL